MGDSNWIVINAKAAYGRHRPFWLLLLLFVSLRLMAILLLRPGGYISDYSDYSFYWEYGRLAPQGYHAYVNAWSPYPPLFHALINGVYTLSTRIPPWVDARLAFNTLLGLSLLAFDTGNLIALYRIARKLYAAGPIPPIVHPIVPPLSHRCSMPSSFRRSTPCWAGSSR